MRAGLLLVWGCRVVVGLGGIVQDCCWFGGHCAGLLLVWGHRAGLLLVWGHRAGLLLVWGASCRVVVGLGGIMQGCCWFGGHHAGLLLVWGASCRVVVGLGGIGDIFQNSCKFNPLIVA